LSSEILTHSIVPAHEILSEDDAKSILMEYGVDRSKLPKILKGDPALPEGAKIGDVIKITRASQTAGTAPYFRVVIE